LVNRLRLPKLIIVTDLLLLMVFCLPGCTGATGPATSTGISGKPYTPPSELPTKTTPPPPTVPSSTLPPRITLEPVNMPPDMTGRISEMLRYLPGSPDINHGVVSFVDFRAWQETLGIDITGYRDDQGNISSLSENTYVNDLVLSPFNNAGTTRIGWESWLGQPPFISGMGLYFGLFGQTQLLETPVRSINIGYGPLDVERSIWCRTYGTIIPGTCEAIKGNFDVAAITQAIGNNLDPASVPLTSLSNGVDIYSWDDSRIFDRALQTPVFDDYGQGRTLAIQSQEILGCIQPGIIDDMLAASQGKTQSLADSLLFQQMAAKMELMGAMSAVLFDGFMVPERRSGSGDKYIQQQEELFEKSALTAPLLEPYVAYAAGLGVDELGLFVALVLVYDSPDLAEDDIPILKERLAAGYNTTKDPWAAEVSTSEIWSDDVCLCAKLYGTVTSYWDCFVGQEPLLVRAK